MSWLSAIVPLTLLLPLPLLLSSPLFLPQPLPVVLPLRVLLPLPVSLPLPLPLHFSWLMWSTSIGSDSLVSFLKSFAIQLLFEFDDRSQLVVTLEQSRVHGWCLAQHHAHCHIIIQLRRRQFLADVHLVFPRILRSLERCRNVAHSPSGAFSATNCLQTSNPFRFGTRCTSLKFLRHLHIPHFVDGQQTTTNTFDTQSRCQSKCFVTMAS